MRFLCPRDSPGKNTGVGCHALLQWMFLTQGLSPCLFNLLHWLVGSLPPAPPGKPIKIQVEFIKIYGKVYTTMIFKVVGFIFLVLFTYI